MKKKCKVCSEKINEDDLFECERCDKEVCLECCTNDYPMSCTICNECYNEFVELMEDNNFAY